MAARQARYAPGWGEDVVAMLSARSAEERAGFLLGELVAGMVVLDVGCGQGSITVGLAEVVGPGGRVVGVDAEAAQLVAAARQTGRLEMGSAGFVAGSAEALPVATGSADVYFAHALFEHLDRPIVALGEAWRVLRPGGLVGLVASDWSRARFAPRSGDVDVAMAGHYALRRRAGGDPFAGARLVEWVRSAGFEILDRGERWLVDLGYAQLAAYVGARLAAAVREDPGDELLARAVAGADRWGRTSGTVSQCWAHVLARVPGEWSATG